MHFHICNDAKTRIWIFGEKLRVKYALGKEKYTEDEQLGLITNHNQRVAILRFPVLNESLPFTSLVAAFLVEDPPLAAHNNSQSPGHFGLEHISYLFNTVDTISRHPFWENWLFCDNCTEKIFFLLAVKRRLTEHHFI